MTESIIYSNSNDIDDSTSKSSHSDDSTEESIRNFFPATRKGFKQVAGKIKRVTKKDFEDKYRLRHLECFRKSMDSWRGFETKFDDYKEKDKDDLWPIFSSVKNSNLNPKEMTYISYETDTIMNNLNGVSNKEPSNMKDYYNKLNKFMYDLFHEFVSRDDVLPEDLIRMIANLRKKYSISPSKHDLLQVFDNVSNLQPFNEEVYRISMSKLRLMLRNKSVRSDSGVTVITVITSPGEFSCPADCHYCPNEPGQPRSYLSTEPAILRANQNDFDPILQFYDRAMTLYKNGHMIDKIEILILGGTWSGYPRTYQESFVRDLFYAANIFPHKLEDARKPLTINEEHDINTTCDHRIIGITIETRPDRINSFELYFLRNIGCTRVQIGIQHTDNEILDKVNRGHHIEDSIKAIYLLKENGFKVDIHLMPDLPYTTVEKDEEMFKRVLSDPGLQVDQWKIYPCEITPFTEIERWYKDGLYTPYFELDPELLIQLLQRVKIAVHPWIRLNRVIRDIPNPSIIAGTNITNMRQLLLNQMKKKGFYCKCIRCRECKDSGIKDSPTLVIRQYNSLGGIEYFISIESHDKAKIYGFLRLRIRENPTYNKRISHFKCLEFAALIRELHVYGSLVPHGKPAENIQQSQHRGVGQLLLLVAEIISAFRGYMKIAIIAGVGTREYYKKHGYELEETYMTKTLNITEIRLKYESFRNNFIKIPNILEIYLIDLNVSKRLVSKDMKIENLIQDYKILQLNLEPFFNSISNEYKLDYQPMLYCKLNISLLDFISHKINSIKWTILYYVMIIWHKIDSIIDVNSNIFLKVADFFVRKVDFLISIPLEFIKMLYKTTNQKLQ